MSEPSENAKKVAYITSDFLIYAPACLKIVYKGDALVPANDGECKDIDPSVNEAAKSGTIVEFQLNRAQLYLHERAEDMLRRKGYVRIIVLKGRQQGVSTYISARFYFKATFEFGKRVFIMTHLDEATANLFNMVRRFYENTPIAFKPHAKKDSEKELFFDRLDTRYSVSTAGSAGTGRSAMAQYMHGSEVAFWANAEQHMAGIGQIIPLSEDTEIFLESTANSTGNYFHQTWLDALAGRSDYEAVFIPWFWQPEYTREVPDDVMFEAEELEYQHTFNLTRGQIYWRQRKITTDFKSDHTLFDQEYPATPDMAFAGGTSRALIKPMDTARAIANTEAIPSKLSPIIIGVDPAEYGDDDTAIVIRWGCKVVHMETHHGEGNEQVAGRVAMLIDKWEPDGVCIDVTGIGTGVEAFLTAQGYKNIYRIHNGEAAIEPEKYRNRGAECWGRMCEWFRDKTLPASLPRVMRNVDGKTNLTEVLRGELSSREFHYDAGRRMVLQSKEEMRKKGIRSPNIADAAALTFAVSIKPRPKKSTGETLAQKLRRLKTRTGRSGGSPGMAA